MTAKHTATGRLGMDEIVTAMLVVLMFTGLSFAVWGSVGIVRLLSLRARGPASGRRVRVSQVAVLIAAHNEEAVIGQTINRVTRLVPARQVFVVSDASTDRTVEIVRAGGAQVLELAASHGKAGALVAGLRHFDLTGEFLVVLILDADTVPSEDYLRTGLPLFDDPRVAAVAGRACTRWSSTGRLTGRMLLAHRERLYVVFQTLLKFGQAARSTNAVTIVPGFASMYRADVLDQLDIAAPGLAVEDYNMTFEVHVKRLGRIAFQPWSARAYTQDPVLFRDYARQVRRWNLGFWQTLRRHRPRLEVFWAAVAIYAAEVLMSSVLVILLVVYSVLALLFALPGESLLLPAWFALLMIDAVTSVYAAALSRRPGLVLFIPAFTVLRIVDAVLCLRALRQALSHTASTGVWRSPARRPELTLES